MTSVGIIHAASLQAPALTQLTIGYLLAAAFLFIYPLTQKDGVASDMNAVEQLPE